MKPEKAERNACKCLEQASTFAYGEIADIGCPSPDAWGPDLRFPTVPPPIPILPLLPRPLHAGLL